MAKTSNSRALVCVCAYYNYPKAVYSLRSAENFLPGFDLFMVVLDLPERRKKPEGNIQVLSAEELFLPEEEFFDQAFFCSEHDFEQVVSCKAVATLLKQYESVALVEAGAALCTPILGLWSMLEKDSILAFEDPMNYGQYPPVWLLQQNLYRNSMGISFYTNGEKMQNFLLWCQAKFAYIRQQGFSKYEDVAHTGIAPSVQTSFYDSWQAFGILFGCKKVKLEGQAVSLPWQGADVEVPALVNFSLLKAEDQLSARQPTLTRLAEEYWNAIRELPKPVNQYHFDFFTDGTPIFSLLRPYISHNYRLRFLTEQNPFKHRLLFTDTTVILGENAVLPLTATAQATWLARPDLQQAFPKYQTEHRLAYMAWFLQYGAQEYRLNAMYTQALKKPYEIALIEEEEKRKKIQRDKKIAVRVVHRLQSIFKANSGQVEERNLSKYPQGVNLCAYIRGDFGIAEGGRILADILQAAGIPFTIIDIEGEKSFQYSARKWNHKISNKFIYNTNLMFTNANGMADFLQEISLDALKDRYNIGYWAWELPEFPEKWTPAFEHLQEVWAPSQFAADAIQTVSPIPVRDIPHSVEVELPDPPLPREYFNLPQEPFIFLMMYDVRSKAERKNPQGAVEAFLKAFEGDSRAALLIKINAPQNWDGEDKLLNTIRKHKNIFILNRTLTRLEVNSLLNCCDAYLSLHRSEGFGLGPAEAMYLGKPTVLTNWSGNTEYMRKDNCCPVDYKIIEIEKDYGPYQKGFHWAHPDTDSAALQMKKLVEDPKWAQVIAQNGQKTIREEFSPSAIGETVRKRLQEVGALEGAEESAQAQEIVMEEEKE